MAQLLPNVKQQFFDSNGDPLASGKLYSYAAGTTTPLATYTDKSEDTANTNPIILDSSGFASIWLGSSAYKLILKDSDDVQQWSVDDVAYVNDGSITTDKINDLAITTGKIAALAVTEAKIADSAVTTVKIKDANVTNAKIADGAVTKAKMDPDLDFTSFNNIIECVVENSGDFERDGGYKVIPQWPWSDPQDITSSIDAKPEASCVSSAWSPNGEYLLVGHNNDSTSYSIVKLFKRTKGSFVSIASPTIPVASALDASWSKIGQMLAFAHSTSPYVSAHQKIGNEFAQLDDPDDLPAGNAWSVSWSPNGEFLAVGHGTTPYLTIYQRSKGSLGGTLTGTITGELADIADVSLAATYNQSTNQTAINAAIAGANLQTKEIQTWINDRPTLSLLTKLADPSDLPDVSDTAGACFGVAWSPDGQYLAVTTNGTTSLNVYQRSGTTFTKLNAPDDLPPTIGRKVCWSPNGKYLCVTASLTPFMAIYEVSGTTLTKLADPASLPPSESSCCQWSPNGKYLAIGSTSTPYLTIYEQSGTTFTKLDDADDLPAGSVASLAWSPNGKFLAACFDADPYFTIYKTSSTIPTKAFLYFSEVPDV